MYIWLVSVYLRGDNKTIFKNVSLKSNEYFTSRAWTDNSNFMMLRSHDSLYDILYFWYIIREKKRNRRKTKKGIQIKNWQGSVKNTTFTRFLYDPALYLFFFFFFFFLLDSQWLWLSFFLVIVLANHFLDYETAYYQPIVYDPMLCQVYLDFSVKEKIIKHRPASHWYRYNQTQL